MTDINELLEAVTVKKDPVLCWAATLPPGDASLFIETLRGLVLQGKHINYTKTRDVLQARLGVTVSLYSLRHHLKGSCSCLKK